MRPAVIHPLPAGKLCTGVEAVESALASSSSFTTWPYRRRLPPCADRLLLTALAPRRCSILLDMCLTRSRGCQRMPRLAQGPNTPPRPSAQVRQSKDTADISPRVLAGRGRAAEDSPSPCARAHTNQACGWREAQWLQPLVHSNWGRNRGTYRGGLARGPRRAQEMPYGLCGGVARTHSLRGAQEMPASMPPRSRPADTMYCTRRNLTGVQV